IKAHALLHRKHRQVDARGQIMADVWQDYLPAAELMGGIVAEASGVSVNKAMQATLDAVRLATVGLAKDEGATSDRIGTLLNLDQSAAWRRLKAAQQKGFVQNLETRSHQPGKYRLTDKEIEAKELLPSPEAIVEAYEGPAHTVQTCIPPDIRQAFED